MDAVRTPLAGIGFAFVLLLAEAFVGSALVTEARTLQAMQQQQDLDEVIATIEPGRAEIILCDETMGMAIRFRVAEAMMSPACRHNPLGKDCW